MNTMINQIMSLSGEMIFKRENKGGRIKKIRNIEEDQFSFNYSRIVSAPANN